ncbi:hypothetical protein [Larkinella humicola]|uniref:Peptidase MA superfamily protein n=1 Tax=Larkinella humicola TaxID=2607654 RepID=A0A5N1JKP6_9BACT|nr:hypothetical protein [Larkinella humicola]KAA9354663.1 hypothetical protein F0P93_08630 [Larkinella humicola]
MRWLVRFLVFLLILPLAYFAAFPQIFRCQLLKYTSDFQQLTPTVWVDASTPERQRVYLLFEINEATKRLEKLWNSPAKGRATVIFCQSPEQYQQYCHDGEGAGCSLGTPWGESWIIINPYGRNPDVLAHEMCHDELYTRLGWLKTQRQIPQWFNEGLALLIDQRFTTATDSLRRHDEFQDHWEEQSHGQQVVLKLTELESLKDFFSGNYNRVMLAYMTAGREVSRWLAVVGRGGLTKLVDRLKAGDDFESVYQRLEREAKTGKGS